MLLQSTHLRRMSFSHLHVLPVRHKVAHISRLLAFTELPGLGVFHLDMKLKAAAGDKLVHSIPSET